LFSQGIVIKEKVKIAPKKSQRTSRILESSQTHSLSVNASWNSDSVGGLFIWIACEKEKRMDFGPSKSPINCTLNNLKPGNYPIYFGVHLQASDQNVVANIKIYVDGVQTNDITTPMWMLTNWICDVYIPGYTDYYFNLTGNMGYEIVRFLQFKPLFDCGNEEFFPSSTNLTMTISEGAEYASFYDDVTDLRIGTSCSGTMDDFANVAIVTDGIIPPASGASVVVEVTGFREPHIDSIKVYPSPIILTPSRNQISMYEETEISVRPYPAWVRIANIYIDQGASYGTLCKSTYDQDYNTIYVYGDTLYDVNIGSQIEFLANEQEPDSVIEVHITAKRTYYTGASTQQFPLDFPVNGKDTVSGSTTITVNPCKLFVTLTPAVVNQGDTALIEVKQKLPDGTIAELGTDNLIIFEFFNNEYEDTLSTMDLSWQDTWIATYDEPRALFIATKNNASPDSFNVKILITANEGTGVGKVTVKKKEESFDHFEVSIVPDTLALADTIAFTEGARLVIQAKDKDDNDVVIDASTPLKFSLLTNNEYGTFIDANSDTLKTTPAQLSNILYGDAKAGKIKFAAVKKNPQTMVACKIHVEKQDDPTRFGERDIVVVEQTLKIVMEAPYQVRPSIQIENTNAARVKQRTKAFEVKMTRGGKSVKNHPFKLWTNYVVGSGGHNHDDTRDTIRQNNNDNYGYFIIGINTKRRPLDTLTNTNGKFATTYSASIFGDTMKIYLKSRSKSLLLDSISVVEKVDSLENFKNVASNDRWICRQSPTGSLRHPDEYNNWCMPIMKDNLKTAIGKFYEWSKEFFGTPIILSLNDMSLLLGGRLDINARWDRDTKGKITQQEHYYHRNGESVDINDQIDRKYKIKTDSITTDKKLTWKWTDTVGIKIQAIFGKSALTPEKEPQIHFELRK
jgi:hypothetical protein